MCRPGCVTSTTSIGGTCDAVEACDPLDQAPQASWPTHRLARGLCNQIMWADRALPQDVSPAAP